MQEQQHGKQQLDRLLQLFAVVPLQVGVQRLEDELVLQVDHPAGLEAVKDLESIL
jgi:hypothetical protein